MSLLVFSFNGLRAMEAEGCGDAFPWSELAEELSCKIMEGVPQEANYLDPKDLVFMVNEYEHTSREFIPRRVKGVESVCWSPNGRFVASGGYGEVVIMEVATGMKASYEHGSTRDEVSVNSVSFSPNSKCIVSGGNDNKVKIMSLMPLWLNTYELKDPTFSQYYLLKRIQERMLKKYRPLILKQSDRYTLEEMPKLKELLYITKCKTKPLWKLSLFTGLL